MLIDFLPHNQNMTLRTSTTGTSSGGNQNPPAMEGVNSCINMMSIFHIATRSRDYCSLQPNMGKEPPPLEIPLYISKTECIPHILKGVLKHLENNPNARATQHYSIFEDLGQAPCVMSAIEVL